MCAMPVWQWFRYEVCMPHAKIHYWECFQCDVENLRGGPSLQKNFTPTGHFCLGLFCTELLHIILSNFQSALTHSNCHPHAPRRAPFSMLARTSPARPAPRNGALSPSNRRRSVQLVRAAAPASLGPLPRAATSPSRSLLFAAPPPRPRFCRPRAFGEHFVPEGVASIAAATVPSSATPLGAAALAAGRVVTSASASTSARAAPCPAPPAARRRRRAALGGCLARSARSPSPRELRIGAWLWGPPGCAALKCEYALLAAGGLLSG